MAGAAERITSAQFATGLARSADTLRRPPAQLLRILATAVKADAALNFDRSAGPDGTPWRPLAFPRASGGGRPLRDKGLLLASLTAGAGHVERYSSNAVVVGTNRPGAALHQYGGRVTPKRGKFLAIPATREASRTAARDFPRTLVALIGKRGGVLVESGKPRGAVQYFLSRGVTVPARPFLGAGPRLLAKLDALIRDYYGRPLAGG